MKYSKSLIVYKDGDEVESLIKQILESQDYQYIDKNKFLLATNGLDQKLYTQNLVISETTFSAGKSKYILSANFVVYNPKNKIKYAIILSHYIIIFDSSGAKKDGKAWLKDQEKTNLNYLKYFQDFSQFRDWAIKNLG